MTTPDPRGIPATLADLPHIKYDDGLLGDIALGDKTATVRIGDAGAGLEPGDRFVATDEDGTPQFVLTVHGVAVCAVRHVPGVLTTFRAKYPHTTPTAVAAGLERHYDREVDLDTRVRVITWGEPGGE